MSQKSVATAISFRLDFEEDIQSTTTKEVVETRGQVASFKRLISETLSVNYTVVDRSLP